jgi:SAM-dependent methyltransferase
MMDLGRSFLFLCDLPTRVLRRLRGQRADYRAFLFEDLRRKLGQTKPRRILEIGPRDGEDTQRLATLGAEEIVLVDLPNQKERIEQWLPKLGGAPVKLTYGNIMYDRSFDNIAPFDVVWCTGVLYHNPEQLRFIRQLFDLTAPGGLLVLETATARLPGLRSKNCVEIWYPPNKPKSRSYHLSVNVTHLPSIKAVESWLAMVGFAENELSNCHRRVLWLLAATRGAWVSRRPATGEVGSYYTHTGGDFPIGRTR